VPAGVEVPVVGSDGQDGGAQVERPGQLADAPVDGQRDALVVGAGATLRVAELVHGFEMDDQQVGFVLLEDLQGAAQDLVIGGLTLPGDEQTLVILAGKELAPRLSRRWQC
jgi:hypothetical protein